MADPFATAAATLHKAAGSVAAVYTAPGGQPIAIRVVRSQPSELVGQRSNIAADTNTVDILRAEVAQPTRGAALQIGMEIFRLSGAAMLDVEGVTWTCPVVPA